MPIIDLHCDTLTELLRSNQSLADNDLRVSQKALQRGGIEAQFFAMFVNLQRHPDLEAAWQHMLSLYEIYLRALSENAETLAKAVCFADLEQNRAKGTISAFLTVEEGGILANQPERLEQLYQMGVRLITLTWNYPNCLGHPNSEDPRCMRGGLSPFGVEMVQRMGELGMLIDVSHLSDGGFWEVARRCPGPFVASHSNARAVTGVSRNLDDAMLRELARHGGVVGINFYSAFLGEDGTGSIAQMLAHIRHIKRVAGIEVLALGSDFDGFDGDCELCSAADFPALVRALEAGGFSAHEIDCITNHNVKRVLREVLCP